MYNVPFEHVQKQMVSFHCDPVRSFTQALCKQENRTAQPSFVATHLTMLSSEGMATQDDIDDIRGSAGTIYGGMI